MISGTFAFNRVANPEFFPIMAGAPSVHTDLNFSYFIGCFSKKLAPSRNASSAFVVVCNGSQKRNSSLISPSLMYQAYSISWLMLEASVDLSIC